MKLLLTIGALGAAAALVACSAPPPAPAPEPWVVEAQLYGRFPEQWSVTCVLASMLSQPYGLRGTTREVQVSKTVEETIQQGAPCPDGRLIDTY